MKNIKKTGWSRESDLVLKEVVYSRPLSTDIELEVFFDCYEMRYEVITTDDGGYRTDRRIQAEGAFTNTIASIYKVLEAAESLHHYSASSNLQRGGQSIRNLVDLNTC